MVLTYILQIFDDKDDSHVPGLHLALTGVGHVLDSLLVNASAESDLKLLILLEKHEYKCWSRRKIDHWFHKSLTQKCSMIEI